MQPDLHRTNTCISEQNPSTTIDTHPARDVIRLACATSRCAKSIRQALLKHSGRLGLSDGELLLLATLQEHRTGLAQNRLAVELAISPARVSGMLEKLKARELVTSRRASADRRLQLWTLTDIGRKLLLACLQELAPIASEIGDLVHAEHRQQLQLWLQSIAAAASGPVDRASTHERRAA